MIVTMIGAGGGVGTSTLGLLLSVALREGAAPEQEIVLLEADRSGGVAGARFDLGVGGGLQAWVAGLATDPNLAVTSFGERIGDGLRVVPAPVAWTEAERILTPGVTEMLAAAMASEDERWWVVDLGRGGGPAEPMTGVADVAVVVTLGVPEHIVRLPSIVKAVRPAPCVVMVSGPATWPIDEIKQHCAAAVVLQSPELGMTTDHVVDLVEGRKRRRSMPWRSVLRCRDAVVELGTRSGTERSAAAGSGVG